jgi:hypothetical protein
VTPLEWGEVTVLVRYLSAQVPVRLAFVSGAREFVWREVERRNYIDERVFDKLEALRVQPSALCSDTVFLRRAHLDLIGSLPAAAEAREFVADTDPAKRARLIDRLLEREEFADFWALKFSDILRNEEKVLDNKGVQVFHRWIRDALARNVPLDRLAHDLIRARGSTYENPPANYYRANRDPVARAETTAQVFLGVRLQCAKCHNHPFDRWTQDDYYGWAAVFERVRYKVLENRRRDRNDKHEFRGEQVVWIDRQGELEDPRTGETVSPRLLGAAEPLAASAGDRLERLADWIARPDNPFFARVWVNRIWFHLMGRGLVDPVDDFRATNPASHPHLLDDLVADFVAGGFDLRRLVRTIASSSTYQLSAETNATNAGDESNYSRAVVRRLSAEQLVDAMSHVTGRPVQFNGFPLGLRAIEVPGVQAVRPRERSPALGDSFLKLFGKPERLLACECERSSETTLGQTFQLLSGPLIDSLLTHPENVLGRLLASERSEHALVEELYWRALARPPARDELRSSLEYIEQAGARRRGFEDLAWSLMNAKEFVLRH